MSSREEEVKKAAQAGTATAHTRYQCIDVRKVLPPCIPRRNEYAGIVAVKPGENAYRKFFDMVKEHGARSIIPVKIRVEQDQPVTVPLLLGINTHIGIARCRWKNTCSNISGNANAIIVSYETGTGLMLGMFSPAQWPYPRAYKNNTKAIDYCEDLLNYLRGLEKAPTSIMFPIALKLEPTGDKIVIYRDSERERKHYKDIMTINGTNNKTNNEYCELEPHGTSCTIAIRATHRFTVEISHLDAQEPRARSPGDG